MSLTRFDRVVSTIDELESIIGLPSELVVRKQLTRLDGHMQAFIARSPFLLLGTAGADGGCDVSPRGELPAVATVLDEHTLVIPERPGNRRADSLRNIIQTQRAGILFVVPGVGETLRINGRACVIRDESILATMSKDGKLPIVGIGIEIEECYFHCAKALIRSKLWEKTHVEKGFDLSRVLAEQLQLEDEDAQKLKERIGESYRDRLF